MRGHTRWVALALVAMTATGCGGSPEPAQPSRAAAGAGSPAASSSPLPTAVAAPPTAASPSAQPTPTRGLQQRADAGRVTAAMLPGRWDPSDDPEGAKGAPTEREDCDRPLLTLRVPSATALSSSNWQTLVEDGSESTSVRVLVYPSVQDASAAYTRWAKVARSCRKWTSDKSGPSRGFEERGQTSALRLGEEGVLQRLTISAVGFEDVPPVHYVQLAAREGDVVVLAQSIWPMGRDRGVLGITELQALAGKALQRAQ